uniref:Cytochrome c biogenesis protein CcsA n=1 Tax=Glaucocystis incrassata TaxID=1789788 RepID=A0A3G1IVL5_9EUKA|nr:cytochrome c biogenesis protein [Glaucocystis incrassata]ASQ39969.1 cytochrome c biogenesis protein [Glaucocystis incrassata]
MIDAILIHNWLEKFIWTSLILTTCIYFLSFQFPKLDPYQRLETSGMFITNIAIIGLLLNRWFEKGYFPLSNLYESLLFLIWSLITIHLFFSYTTKNKLIGLITSPLLSVLCSFVVFSLPSEMHYASPLVPALKSHWLMMHVSVMLISYAALITGSLFSIVFLILTYGKQVEIQGNSYGINPNQKKQPVNNNKFIEQNYFSSNYSTISKTSSIFQQPLKIVSNFSLNSLSLAQNLDNLSYRIIGLGFPLLTIGIIAGAVWANEAWGSYWSWDPKETWALITWLVFAAYLHTRITKGWQGKKPAILATFGFFVIWICYLGVNLIGKGIHSYGWFF